MADLPVSRVSALGRAFVFVGIDFFGPLFAKRGRATVKKWGCIFTCLTVRACHLELADSLETDDFLLVFRSFIARRGTPQEVYSDNGTNFVGAQRELQRLLKGPGLHHFLTDKIIKWHFIPPRAPHFGGVWERLIKSAKIAMMAVLKNQLVSESVLRTVIIETEGILNSRPLTYNSADPKDLTPLTPNHFLHLGSSTVSAPGIFNDGDLCSRKKWRQCQVLVDHVWRRWLKEYLPMLTVRVKWTKEKQNLKIDDVVLLVDDDAPRNRWTLGRIVETVESADGRVRSVKVKTASGTYHRPVSKLCLLEDSASQGGCC